MTEREAFIRRICEEPDEDTHRLVFADWLDEHGESERAEFIRVQVELAGKCEKCFSCRYIFFRGQFDPDGADVLPNGYIERCPQCNPGLDADCPSIREIHQAEMRLKSLLLRERELWGSEWLMREFPQFYVRRGGNAAGDGCVAWLDASAKPLESTIEAVFRRGFVHAITCTHDDFLRHAEAIFRAHPVTSVTLSDAEPAEQGNGNWVWREWHEDTRDADELHEDLFTAMCGDSALSPWYFHSREDAISALVRACVSLGRKRAGLPTLPQHLIGPHKSAQV